MSKPPLWMWVIYDHPKDFPDFYVARPQFIDAAGDTQYDEGIAHKDLDRLRALMAEMGRVCLARHPNDDPVIVECWI